jgi:hypothetical protein
MHCFRDVSNSVNGIHASRARICKRYKKPSNQFRRKSIPPAYVAWRAGTTNKVVVPAS